MPNRSWSKIAVVGAGAVGSYFGGMLARAGADVTLIGRRPHVEAINHNGLLFKNAGGEQRIPVAATEDIAAVSGAELVLFCVKSLDTDAAARAMAPHLARDAVVLSLQNGVDNAERIRRHIENLVLPALVYSAANIPAPGSVTHTGGGNIIIGLLRDDREAADRSAPESIASLFVAAGVPVKVSDAIEVDLWTKLVMNCAYNAVCALTGAPYGRMVAMPEVRAIMEATIDEVIQVARAKGVDLPADITEAAIKLAEVMPQTMSSTAQDIRRGKPTEIDHLNGFVVRQGEALRIATPVNRTLNALTKLLEQQSLNRGMER